MLTKAAINQQYSKSNNVNEIGTFCGNCDAPPQKQIMLIKAKREKKYIHYTLFIKGADNYNDTTDLFQKLFFFQ